MSYYNLQNLCAGQYCNCRETNKALMSNRKYILPCNKVYNIDYTLMYKYPSENSLFLNNEMNNSYYPEKIKAYNVDIENIRKIYNYGSIKENGNSKCSRC